MRGLRDGVGFVRSRRQVEALLPVLAREELLAALPEEDVVIDDGMQDRKHSEKEPDVLREVREEGLGYTAPSNFHHFVGYLALGVQLPDGNQERPASPAGVDVDDPFRSFPVTRCPIQTGASVQLETGVDMTTDWDEAGRRTRGVIRAGAAGALFFEEQIGYDADDRVNHLVWPHGRAGSDAEAQTFDCDQMGRLLTFRQGLWDGSAVTGTPTAFHDWNLDEQGNWREHRETESDPYWSPELDQVNAYTRWDASFDRDGDGPEELLTLVRDHDEARAFLYRKEESDGSFTRYLHDALGRLVEVQRDTGTGPETVVRYGLSTLGDAGKSDRAVFGWDRCKNERASLEWCQSLNTREGSAMTLREQEARRRTTMYRRLVILVMLGAILVVSVGLAFPENIQMEAEKKGEKEDATMSRSANDGYRILVSKGWGGSKIGCDEWRCLWPEVLRLAKDRSKWKMLLDGDDITTYDWARQEFHVTTDVERRILEDDSSVPENLGSVFLVLVDGKPVFAGVILLWYSSGRAGFPVMYVERGDDGVKIRIRSSHRLPPPLDGPVHPELEALIYDERVRQALERHGVLKEGWPQRSR